MHYTTKFALGLLGSTALALGGMPAAYASFGPANGSASILGNPTVVTSGTLSISWASLSLFWSGNTGPQMSTVNGINGAISGSLTFSGTAGNNVVESVPSLFSVTDGSSNTLTFSVSKVTTVSYFYDPTTSGSLTLYVLGTMGGGTASPTATSMTLTANDTSGGSWNSSFSLANPPSPVPPSPPSPPSVPEPASLALMGTGLIGLSALRRGRRK